MAKLKPLRKEEDISAIPLTEPVLVELGPIPTGVDTAADTGAQAKPAQNENEDLGVKQLSEQLEALKTADKQRQEALDRAEKEKRDALALAEQRQTELHQSQAQNEAAIADSISSQLTAAQSEQEAAEAEYAKAYEAQDAGAMAKAQGKIARAAAKVLNFESASAELAERKDRQAKEPQRQQQQQPLDFATAVKNDPNLLPNEKDWVLAHQEVMIDPARNAEMKGAHYKAVRHGLIRGTPDYFKFLDTELGYAKPAQTTEETDEGSTIMSAPASRDTTSLSTGQRQESRVTLTPEQRAFAKTMGISEVAYAQQVLNMQRDKKENPERYSSRG